MSFYAVVDPATGDVVTEYAAAKAHRQWSKKSTLAERSSLMKRVAELHNERRDELARII